MPETRKLKKSESLEIRIPYPTKEAFMARCRAEGRSASEALRDFIESQITPSGDTTRPSRKPWRLLVVAGLAAAMGAVAVPSLARVVQAPPAAHLRAEFVRMDANRDGVVDFGEYRNGTAELR